MNHSEFSTLCARINAALDVQDVIRLVDYHSDKAIQSAGLWRMFCPLHEEKVFRTLVINPRRNTYFCEYTHCSGHQAGDLIELLARVKKLNREDTVVWLIDKRGGEALRLSREQVKLIKAYSLKVARQA